MKNKTIFFKKWDAWTPIWLKAWLAVMGIHVYRPSVVSSVLALPNSAYKYLVVTYCTTLIELACFWKVVKMFW